MENERPCVHGKTRVSFIFHPGAATAREQVVRHREPFCGAGQVPHERGFCQQGEARQRFRYVTDNSFPI